MSILSSKCFNSLPILFNVNAKLLTMTCKALGLRGWSLALIFSHALLISLPLTFPIRPYWTLAVPRTPQACSHLRAFRSEVCSFYRVL